MPPDTIRNDPLNTFFDCFCFFSFLVFVAWRSDRLYYEAKIDSLKLTF